MRIEQWKYFNGMIEGEIYNHPKFADGDFIRTDKIVFIDKDVASAQDGSKYILGAEYSVEEETSIEALISKVEKWAEDRDIFANSTPKDQALKTVAEVGEFADNVLKGRCCKDDIGDIIVTLILQCHLQGYTITDCLQLAYDEISTRKGKMVNGTFVKEGDLIEEETVDFCKCSGDIHEC